VPVPVPLSIFGERAMVASARGAKYGFGASEDGASASALAGASAASASASARANFGAQFQFQCARAIDGATVGAEVVPIVCQNGREKQGALSSDPGVHVQDVRRLSRKPGAVSHDQNSSESTTCSNAT
jgi:hypothetical protein